MASNITLKGDNIILRPLSLKDAPNFCKWLKDQEVAKFLGIYDQPVPTLKEERQWIKDHQKDKETLDLAIETKEGVHIGSIALRDLRSNSNRATFGIMIGDKKYWGQGLGTEAAKLVIEYGFKKLKLHRIYLQHLAYNIRGHKSYKKVGFRKEGEFRDQVLRDGHYHNVIWMGILKNEYLKKKQKNNKSKKKSYGRKAKKN
ncbi:MAG: GNAT family N-acetyltransferase [Parcubacteria group bacterium]|jgi:RimJ/RimL family protein N-acetyltransferase|nr:GNAT family N-acetyltransferase [Parcubacteria group bacterium]|tara:strand:+ start:6835 stop:7437 length:603 start_codon:yes stop_codon:yes gene_type:complete